MRGHLRGRHRPALTEQLDEPPTARVELPERGRVVAAARSGRYRVGGAGANRRKGVSHALAEEVDETGDVRLGTTQVVVVRRPDRQCRVVRREVAGVVLVERVDPLQTVPGPVQDQRGEQPRGATVAVIVGMDRRVLIVRDGRHNRHGKILAGQLGVDPLEEPGHEPGDITRIRRQVHDASGRGIADDVLSCTIGRRGRLAGHDQSVNAAQLALLNRASDRRKRLRVLQRAVVVADLRLIALPPGKVRACQGLGHLSLGEPVALDLRGVMRRSEPGGVPQPGQHLHVNGKLYDRLPVTLDGHERRGDRRGNREDGSEHHARVRR